MLNQIINYDYKGNQISFINDETVLINATEMAKPFGKRTNDWLSLKQTNELIHSLSAKTGISATGLVTVNQGGNNQGTWLYEDLALVFAQWLNPEFYFWCNDRIKELLKYGVTATETSIESLISNPESGIKLLQALQQERAEKAMLQEQNTLQTQQLQVSAPKVQYFDNVMQSVNTYTTTQVAKEMGMDAQKLNKYLRDKHIVFRQSGQWLLTCKYQNQGYTKTRTQQFTRSDGSTGTNSYTVWTERGRNFLHSIINPTKN